MIVGNAFPDKRELKPMWPWGENKLSMLREKLKMLKRAAFGVDSPPTIKHLNAECLGVVFPHRTAGAFIGWAHLPHHFFTFKNGPTLSRHVQRNTMSSLEKKTPFLTAWPMFCKWCGGALERNDKWCKFIQNFFSLYLFEFPTNLNKCLNAGLLGSATANEVVQLGHKLFALTRRKHVTVCCILTLAV